MPQRPEDIVLLAWHAIAKADDVTLERLIGPQGEEQGHLKGGLARVAVGIETFDRAMTQKFGPSKMPRFASAGTVPGLKAVPTAGEANLTTVIADLRGVQTEIQLIRQDAEWRLTFEGVRALLRLRQVDLPLPHDEALRRMNEMGEAIQAAANEVLAGEFPTAEAAQQAGREALVDASRGKNAQ